MAVSEQQRHQLHSTLEAKIGAQEAATLMEYLPPVGWADVARRSDVDGVRHDVDGLRHDVDRLRHDMEDHVAALRREIQQAGEIQMSRTNELVTRSQNRIILAMMGTMLATVIAVTGLAFAAAGLT